MGEEMKQYTSGEIALFLSDLRQEQLSNPNVFNKDAFNLYRNESWIKVSDLEEYKKVIIKKIDGELSILEKKSNDSSIPSISAYILLNQIKKELLRGLKK